MSHPPAGPIRISAVIQLDPVWRPGKPGEPFAGDLAEFAEGMTRFLADGLKRFAGERGADLFVTLIAERDGEEQGYEFRTGQYVKFPDLPGPLPAPLDNPVVSGPASLIGADGPPIPQPDGESTATATNRPTEDS